MTEHAAPTEGDQSPTVVRADPRTAPMIATPPDLEAPSPATDAVVELQIVGTNICYPLAERREYLLGAGDQADLVIEGDNVSRRHARLIHQGTSLRVIDQGSTNGTYCAGHRAHDFEVGPGDIFGVSRRIEVVVLDEHLRLLRDGFYWILGLRAHGPVSEALRLAVTPAPIVLLGPAGCDQAAIATQIHRATAGRTHAYLTSEAGFATADERRRLIAQREPAVAFVDLHRSSSPLPAAFVAHLFRDGNRPIVAAPDLTTARRALDVYANRLQPVTVAPIATRRDEIARLLDALVRHTGQGSAPVPPLPLVVIGAENLRGLASHDWPENFDDLRRTATRLHALLTHNLGVRAAARFLGRAHSSVVQALARVGVRFPTEPGDGDEIKDASGDMVRAVPPEAAHRRAHRES